MREKKKKTGNQSGRSMIEMLGVLAIIGVLSVGGLAGYNMAMRKIRVNRAIEELHLVIQEIYMIYGELFNKGQVNVLPETNIIDLQNYRLALNSAGENISVYFGKDASIKLSHGNVPKYLCQAIVSSVYGFNNLIMGADGSIGWYWAYDKEAVAKICKTETISFSLQFEWIR